MLYITKFQNHMTAMKQFSKKEKKTDLNASFIELCLTFSAYQIKRKL